MTDTAPPEQILTEAADKALSLAQELTDKDADAGTHLAYLAGLIRGGITNLAIAYDRGWDEGYDAAPTPLAAPADLAAVWQGLNDEQRAVMCIVSPELAGMLDAAEDPAPEEVTEALDRWEQAQQSVRDAQDALTRVREEAGEQLEDMQRSLVGESEMGPPPYYLARLRAALGDESDLTFDEAVVRVDQRHRALGDALGRLDRYREGLTEALELDERGDLSDVELVKVTVGVVERARRAAHAWAGTGEPGTVAATALQDLVHYLDERAA